MVDTKHVFQVSGIKNLQKKGKLLHGIIQLGGKYIGGSVSVDIIATGFHSQPSLSLL